MRRVLLALVMTTWSSAALAQGAPPPAARPAAPPPPPAPAPAPGPTAAPPMTVPPAAGTAWVLGPAGAPAGAAPPPAAAPPPPPPSPRPVEAVQPPAPPARFVGRYDPYVRRPLVVEGHASFGGPVGWIGLAIDYSLVRYLSVMAGAGIGQSGPQLGGMLRLRIPLDTVSAGYAIGGSAGEYEDTLLSSSTSDRRRWETAYWLNNEGFFEIRTHKGINIRPYIGSGFILNRSDGKPIARDEVCVTQGTKSLGCTAPTGGQRDGNQFLFYGGVAIGYAFEL